MAGSQGCCGENEGGWSIPEAAGARGCLLGCAGPTRSSFGQQPQLGVIKERNGTREGKGGELSQTLWGLLETLEGRAQAGRGPPEVFRGPPQRRLAQAGGRQALAGEGEMP